MSNEKLLKELSDHVYRLDRKHKDFDSTLREGKHRRFGEVQYKILTTEDNTTNGMQAMAVAPIKNNKVDTSEIVSTMF